MTSEIIVLHAKSPEKNAAVNPAKREYRLIPDSAEENPPEISSRKLSPNIGTKTIRKENFAISSLLTPRRRPVDMVAPDLDRPGSTANA